MSQENGERSIFGAMRDRRMLSWLFGFIKRRVRFLALSLVLMTLTAVVEIAVPYIAGYAVDKHISLLWAKTPGGAIIDVSSSEDTKQHTRSGGSPERYFVVDTSDPGSEASRIVNRNPGLFKSENNTVYASGADLLSLSDGDIKTLRARNIEGLTELAFLTAVCVLLIFAMSSLSNYLLKISGERIIHDIRVKTFGHIMSLPQKFFDKNPVGRITTRVTNDLNAINDVYSSVIVQTLKDLLLLVGVSVVMFRLDFQLALMIIFIVGLAGFTAHLFRTRLRFSHRRIRRSIARLNSFVQESVKGVRIIKDYGREEQNLHRFKETNRENFLANMQQLWVYVLFRPFMEYAAIGAIGVIIWHGGIGVIEGRLTVGTLIAFLYYARMMFRPVLEVSEKYNILQSAIAATENLYEINDVKPEEPGEYVPEKSSGDLEFQNVWFSYGDDRWALKDVSFKVSAGQWVAIVGLTGSGKSTMFNLIFRLYSPQRGKITFDGRDIGRMKLKWLRSRIAPVFQEIKEYERKDGEAVFLSSGETQIKNIEEVLSENPSVVIMDEATSNMDAETERETINRVRALSYEKGFSLITIAHRLSSVREADKILVVHKGEIVESGTHTELKEKSGVYHSLNKFAGGVNKAV